MIYVQPFSLGVLLLLIAQKEYEEEALLTAGSRNIKTPNTMHYYKMNKLRRKNDCFRISSMKNKIKEEENSFRKIDTSYKLYTYIYFILFIS